MSVKGYCFLCKTKEAVAFHRFPADENVRQLWFQACKLQSIDNVRNIRVCSNHFLPEDYVDKRAREFGGRLRLKADSVPKCTSTIKKNMQLSSSAASSEVAVERKFELQASCSQRCRDHKVIEENIMGQQPSTYERIYYEDVLSDEVIEDSMEEQPCVSQEYVEIVPIENIIEPSTSVSKHRYIGDFKSPNVATPRRAKRSSQLAKSVAERQRKKIIILQQRNRRLIKRLTDLEELLTELTTENLITDRLKIQ